MNEKDIDNVCSNCLDKEPNVTCGFYVERMVGDCQAKEIKTIMATDGKKYKVMRDVYYYPGTADNLILLLEHLRTMEQRYRFYFGDPKTGLDWEEICDVLGYIKLTTGRIRMPILVFNNRCWGGGILMTDNIVRIDWANKKGHETHRTLYINRYYHTKQDEHDLWGDKKVDVETIRNTILERRMRIAGPSVNTPYWEFRDGLHPK